MFHNLSFYFPANLAKSIKPTTMPKGIPITGIHPSKITGSMNNRTGVIFGVPIINKVPL